MATKAGLNRVIKNFLAGFSLRKKLSIAFVMIALLPVMITNIITWQVYEQTLKDLAVERNQRIAHETAGKIEYDEAIYPMMDLKKKSIIIIVATGIIAFFIGIGMGNSLVRRIKDISETANRVAQGDLKIHLDHVSSDEIGQLAEDFNNMIKELGKRDKKALKRTKELTLVNEELQRLSFMDELTDISNRRYFDEFLAKEWQRAKRNQTSLALIMLDVDYFKEYNDTYGHVAGDECLKHVAKILNHSAQRATDFVARYGGEEFTLVLPDTDERGGMFVGEMVRANVEKLKIKHESSLISDTVTVSVGVAVFRAPLDVMPTDMIAEADKALYEAKQKGRNRVEIWNQRNRRLS